MGSLGTRVCALRLCQDSQDSNLLPGLRAAQPNHRGCWRGCPELCTNRATAHSRRGTRLGPPKQLPNPQRKKKDSGEFLWDFTLHLTL